MSLMASWLYSKFEVILDYMRPHLIHYINAVEKIRDGSKPQGRDSNETDRNSRFRGLCDL